MFILYLSIIQWERFLTSLVAFWKICIWWPTFIHIIWSQSHKNTYYHLIILKQKLFKYFLILLFIKHVSDQMSQWGDQMLVSSDNAIISHVDLIMAPFQMTMNQMVICLFIGVLCVRFYGMFGFMAFY
jgi:hypothetical protein